MPLRRQERNWGERSLHKHPRPLQGRLNYWWGAETRNLSRSLRKGPQEILVLGQKRGMSVCFGLARGQDAGRDMCFLILPPLLKEHHDLKGERRQKGGAGHLWLSVQPPPCLTLVSFYHAFYKKPLAQQSSGSLFLGTWPCYRNLCPFSNKSKFHPRPRTHACTTHTNMHHAYTHAPTHVFTVLSEKPLRMITQWTCVCL